MAERNLQLEQQAIGEFGAAQGRMPESPEDWEIVHQRAYGANVPAELTKQIAESKAAAGFTSPAQVDTTPAAGTLADVEAKRAEAASYRPTSFAATLKEALMAKTKGYETPLGKSEAFEKAGVTGIGALSYALSSRADEIGYNREAMQNMVKYASGMYADLMDSARQNYEDSMYLYEQAQEREQQALTENKAIALDMVQNGMTLPEEFRTLLGSETFDLFQKTADQYKSVLARSGGSGSYTAVPKGLEELDTAATEFINLEKLGTPASTESWWNTVNEMAETSGYSADEVNRQLLNTIRRKKGEPLVQYNVGSDFVTGDEDAATGYQREETITPPSGAQAFDIGGKTSSVIESIKSNKAAAAAAKEQEIAELRNFIAQVDAMENPTDLDLKNKKKAERTIKVRESEIKTLK